MLISPATTVSHDTQVVYNRKYIIKQQERVPNFFDLIVPSIQKEYILQPLTSLGVFTSFCRTGNKNTTLLYFPEVQGEKLLNKFMDCSKIYVPKICNVESYSEQVSNKITRVLRWRHTTIIYKQPEKENVLKVQQDSCFSPQNTSDEKRPYTTVFVTLPSLQFSPETKNTFSCIDKYEIPTIYHNTFYYTLLTITEQNMTSHLQFKIFSNNHNKITMTIERNQSEGEVQKQHNSFFVYPRINATSDARFQFLFQH